MCVYKFEVDQEGELYIYFSTNWSLLIPQHHSTKLQSTLKQPCFLEWCGGFRQHQNHPQQNTTTLHMAHWKNSLYTRIKSSIRTRVELDVLRDYGALGR